MAPLPENLAATLRAFQESRILLTAIELDLFHAVGQGCSAAEVAARLGTDARATEMLMNALAAMGILVKNSGVFQNTPAAAEHFASGRRLGYLHNVNLWQRWSQLTACVKQGTAADLVDLEQRGKEWIAAFVAAMQRNSEEGAPAVVRAIDASSVRRMLDVGGGPGAYSIAFAQAYPNLHAVILDLEPVLEIAQTHIEQAGLAGRVSTRCGDLHSSDFGQGYDMVFISSVCHMLSPEENAALFRKALAALEPGGRIVVRDFILEADKTAPRQAAIFSLNMLVNTRAGANYSHLEYRQWLEQAGFAGVRQIELPTPASLMIGVKP